MKKETTPTHLHHGPLFKGLSQIVSTDQLRPIFCSAHIKNGFIIATDAHVLVKIDLVKYYGFPKDLVELLNGKYISKKVLTELSRNQKGSFIRIDQDGFHFDDMTFLFKNFDLKFPNVDNVILDDSKKESIEYFKLNGANLNKIYNVNKYNGYEPSNLMITSFGRNKHLKIQNDQKTFVGIIMPISL